MSLTNQEIHDKVRDMISCDGWQLFLIPLFEKRHAALLNEIAANPYASKAYELGQLAMVRVFLDVARNNERLAAQLQSEADDRIPEVPFVAGSPYSLPTPRM